MSRIDPMKRRLPELAFEPARADECINVDAVRQRLTREGKTSFDLTHISGTLAEPIGEFCKQSRAGP